MFHRVLVATGGSPWSDNAIKYAIGLAKDYQLEVVILHVLTETPSYFVAEAGTSLDSILEGSEEAGRRIVDDVGEYLECCRRESPLSSVGGEAVRKISQGQCQPGRTGSDPSFAYSPAFLQ